MIILMIRLEELVEETVRELATIFKDMNVCISLSLYIYIYIYVYTYA